MSLTGIFANFADPEVERSPEDAALSARIFERMVGQVKAGVKPWNVTPPNGIAPERSRELLKGTGIHGALKAEWEKIQSGEAKTQRQPYDGRNPNLPTPHWWSFLR
jgi:hypothetical protein